MTRRRLLRALLPWLALASCAGALGLDWAWRSERARELDERLTSLALTVGEALDVEPNGSLEINLDPAIAARFGPDLGRYAVRNRSGAVVAASSPEGADLGQAKGWRSVELTMEREAGAPGNPFRIEVALPTSELDAASRADRTHLALALAGLLGWLLLLRSLLAALDRAEAAYEAQKRFTADAAHELRTPLAAIRTQCEVALRKPRSPAELLDALAAVHRVDLRVIRLVESLLSLARLDAAGERAALQLETTDLGELASRAVASRKEAAEARGVRLELEAEGPVPVEADSVLIEECLACLLDNAIQASPAGGFVRVSSGARPRPWAAVEDNGEGIEPEHLPRIFERFYQADPSRDRRSGGLGLGLSIARTIAELHGARLLVESQPGSGSRFELRWT